ncbi:MAG: acetate--CoA ligase family protein [Methanosarcinales archaeon]|nr:acetate--CoA ligase family protein [Methanosarcinales archaeon]
MLERFFNPGSVAIIGASREKGKVGRVVLENVRERFRGAIYPVNPGADEIDGMRCYPDISSTPPVDLAIIVVPAKIVPDVLEECGTKGITNVVIISAGFREAGAVELETRCVDIIRRYGMRALGPNSLGFIDTRSSLNASFASGMAIEGNIGLASQSGALCTAILDWSTSRGIGFSTFISLGNKADINENDIITALTADEGTNVILLYLEGIKYGRKFMEIAGSATYQKPIIVVKAGRTRSGARAVSSHTGTLAGSDAAYDAAFNQSGVIRAESVEEMFDYALAFSYQKVPSGSGVAIITNAGGPGVLAADTCESLGVTITSFEQRTIEALRSSLPAAANIYNPVDVLGDARPDRYKSAIEAVINDDNVSGIIVLASPQAMTDMKRIAEIIVDVSHTSASSKPILVSLMGGELTQEGGRILSMNRIPNYEFPERAARAMCMMIRYAGIAARTCANPPDFDVDRQFVKDVLNEAKERGDRRPGVECLSALEKYGIPVADSAIAITREEAVAAADRIGYPVVMKIMSSEISHKTDVGGVRTGINDADEVRIVYDSMMHRIHRYVPDARIKGVLIQKMLEGGREVILGMNRDPQFGPVLMFGLGGISVEVLKDVAFRIAPITEKDADDMIKEIRAYPMLLGIRGEEPSDIGAIKETLLRFSKFCTDFPEIAEIDINPLLVFKKGCAAVDIRLTLEE